MELGLKLLTFLALLAFFGWTLTVALAAFGITLTFWQGCAVLCAVRGIGVFYKGRREVPKSA